MKNLYYIAIEGVIGVGKTSLARLLSDRLNAKLVLERFEENPFLDDFYTDRERFAFQTQLWFLLSRYRQQQEIRQVDLFHHLLVTDYMFVKDRLFAFVNLDDKELALYEKIADLLERDIPKPDLVIYLQADTNRLMKNIKNRARTFENPITAEYIDTLNQVYNQYFFQYNSGPLLIINATEIDFVNNKQDLEDLIQTIRQPITGTKFYNPSKN
ncbi:MAG: deoxynucleoside kinase [Candidatus Marinimicrobia bacterium]|nr:deoxynucleoside kinase [Candidatus Neomarinimicrobiota bacterium]